MSRKPLLWFESLTDSVSALGAAARETRTAYQAARASTTQYDLDRVRLLDGTVTIPGPPNFPVRPHDRAVMHIGSALRDCEYRMESLYNQAALNYAYGTAWVILRVLDGEEPPRVELGLTSEGHLNIPNDLAPIPPAIDLDRWRDNAKLEQARQRWDACDSAGEYASALDDEDYLADHEAYEMHEAYTEARGIADAAYAYGVLAEPALRYALLGPRARARHTNP